MAWWKGDDKSHGNLKLLAVGLDGIGLHWQAVSWCAAHETNGCIPEYVIPSLAPGVHQAALKRIVHRLTQTPAGAERPLWKAIEGGYEINDYLKYNPSRKQLEAKREAERERIANRRAAGTSFVDANTQAG